MTKKRFTYDSKTVSILKDGEFWLDGNIDTACNHSEICNELNKLTEENEQLKSDNNRLVNETARIVAEHQGRVLDLIDRKIEYYSDKYELYDTNAIEVLEELKKELVE